MGYSLDPISANCYPSTSVLVNKFDIHNEAKLNEVETVLVSTRNAEWLNRQKTDSFDFTHYKAIPYFLFSDLYNWTFDRLKEQGYFRGLPHDAFTDEIVDFCCATNNLHPFRKGNGRTLTDLLQREVYSSNRIPCSIS